MYRDFLVNELRHDAERMHAFAVCHPTEVLPFPSIKMSSNFAPTWIALHTYFD